MIRTPAPGLPRGRTSRTVTDRRRGRLAPPPGRARPCAGGLVDPRGSRPAKDLFAREAPPPRMPCPRPASASSTATPPRTSWPRRVRPRGGSLRRRWIAWECRPMQRSTAAAWPRSWPRRTAPSLLLVVSLLVLRLRGRGQTNAGVWPYRRVTSPQGGRRRTRGARSTRASARSEKRPSRCGTRPVDVVTTSRRENQHDDRCGKDGE
jgi:hypothetical protein